MIIDVPLIPDLCRGTDRAMPQTGDNQVIVPAVIQPIVDVMLPTNMNVGANVLANGSVFSNFAITRTNAIPVTVNLHDLPRGLYEIESNMAVRANYGSTIGTATADVILRLVNGAGTASANLLMVFAISDGLGNSNAQNVSSKFTLLLLENMNVDLLIQATGVGDIIDVSGAVNCVRRL